MKGVIELINTILKLVSNYNSKEARLSREIRKLEKKKDKLLKQLAKAIKDENVQEINRITQEVSQTKKVIGRKLKEYDSIIKDGN